MKYNHLLPIGTLVTCTYQPIDTRHHGKLPYTIAAVVIKTGPTRNTWRVLKGGWNHSDITTDNTYGLPEACDPDYHSFTIHTIDTFPYPELLI